MRWSEEQTVSFVKIYLQHEYLWNTKHEHYGNKYLRKKAYKDIGSLFEKTTGIPLTDREVMTKIRNLSSTYVQEMAKIKKSSESGHPYQPAMKWFHYWYRCKHGNQPVNTDSEITFNEQKMGIESSEDDSSVSFLTPKSEKNGMNLNSSHPKKLDEEETLTFAKIFLQQDILWNPKHPFFRNHKLREETYRKICSEFETATGIALSEREVLLKIKSLKSTYWQEHRKIKRFSKDFTYVPSMKWYAIWDRCYNTRYTNEETDTGVSESVDLKLWLQLSNDEDEDMVAKQSKNEETMKTRWNETDTLKFVKIYLQYEFLYNPRHKYFRQKKLRREGYNSIITEFETATGIRLDEKELKSKIKSLGSTYAQELSKIKKRTGQPYSPTIKWFKYWHKRKQTMQKRNAQNADNDTQEPADDSPLSELEEEEEQKSEDEDDEQKFEVDVEQKFEIEHNSESHHSDSESECEVKKRKIEKSQNQEHSEKIGINFVDANSDNLWRDDEFEHYGKYIASVLRRMGLEKALQIQLEIQNLLSVTRKG